jgi:cytoskeleton protein RodZ
MAKVTRLNVGEGANARNRQFPLREIPDDADAPLGTIGQELRGARMSRGEDLVAVSRALKIRKDHLEAIEDDRFNALPGRTYAVGFVRAYAEYVGLDPIYAVDRFKTEVAGRDETSPTAGFVESPEAPGLSRGWLLVGLIILGLMGYGVYYLWASGGSQTNQTIAAVPASMVEKHHPAVFKHTPTRVVATSPPQAALAAGSETPVAPLHGGQIYGKMNTDAHVVLRAKQATRVLVQTADGRAFINKALEPGDIYQVPNMHGLALTAEHGDAVEIFLDGKSIGDAGKGNEAAEALPLDRDNLAGRVTGTPPPQ